jgi:gas vesicle protein
MSLSDYERIGDYQASEHSRVTLGLTFLLVGLGLGAVAALILAPQSGRLTRQMLRRKYEEARDVLEDLTERAGQVVERGGEWANAAREKVAPITRGLRDEIS